MHILETNPGISKLDIHRWSLVFKDPITEKRYKEEYFKKSLVGFRISFIIVTLLYASFGILDLLTNQLFYKDFYIVRYVIVSPVLVLTWILSFHSKFKNYWQVLISFCFLIGGVGIVYMLYKNPANIYYYGGMFLIFMAGYFFVKLHFLHAVIPAVLVLIAYNFGASIFPPPYAIPLENILITNVFYISANIIAIVALYNIKIIERSEFKQRFLLLEQKEEIKRVNENLESLVQDRTQSLENRNKVLKEEINSRKEIEKKLIQSKLHAEESDRLKSAFLANMSHEIRTPMNGIIGFLDLISSANLSKNDQLQYLGIVRQSSSRLLETLNNIIELSKIEVGELDKNDSVVNIGQTLKFISEYFVPELQSKSLELRINTILNDKRIITDASKLESILTNLVNNAIKFTNNGFIELGAKMKDKHLLFYVKDTGIGIPKNRQEAIFDRFVQADLSISRGYEGSGLGLSICKAYIELLGGEIWVESASNEGATFFFTIQLEEAPIKTTDSEKAKAAKMVTSKIETSKMVLIVEDDDVSYSLIETILKSKNIKVVRAKNGLEAVNEFESRKDISLIIMDIKMPVMDGIVATEKIREINNKIPIIAQTAYALAGDKEKLLNSGFNDYISKPLKKNDLLALIDKY